MSTLEKTKAPVAAGAIEDVRKGTESTAGSLGAAEKIGKSIVADLSEPRRLFSLGFKLCKLMPRSKRPEGENWNAHAVTRFDESATGYGVMLAANGLCSVDPDRAEDSRKLLAAFGFDLEKLLDAGVRSLSTRPGSGGRSVFRADPTLRKVLFSFKELGTVLELRAYSPNLQDVIPGLIYADKSGELQTQHYANDLRLDDAPELPPAFRLWWKRMSTDFEFKREQQRLAGETLGVAAHLSVSSADGKTLAFPSPMRRKFNEANNVDEILLKHGYEQTVDGRFSPPTATGAPGIRRIPGKDDLLCSDHASDRLAGIFDAWTAYVVLEHEGDKDAAEAAWISSWHLGMLEEFEYCDDVSDLTDKEPAGGNLRFRVVPADEFSQGRPPGWIIKGVIPRAELVVLFGESGSGKSFLALDMAAAIVRGIDWRGNRTKAGRVVYIAAEGGGGFRNRLRAYELHHGVSFAGMSLGIIHATPNFLQKADALDVAKAIVAGGPADVVIVDTFAQVIPGANENAAEDIGKALTHCRGIHKATGAAVVLVHHAGKDPTKGARGWSGIRAAADAEIEVLRLPMGRLVRISKQKDGIDGREWGFDLHAVPVGMDEDGEVIDSCVVREAEIPAGGRIDPKKRVGPWEKLVLDVVGEIALGQNSGIEVDQVLAEVMRRGPAAEDGKRDTRKQRARRALLTLCEGDEAPFFLENDCLSVL